MNIGNTLNTLAPSQEPLNLRAIQQNLMINFGWGQDIDNATPMVAMAIAQEIQNKLSSGHPLRVYMFNFLSDNAYNNPEFVEIVRVTMGRIVLGVRNQEFQNFTQAVQVLVPACVKFAASYLASQEAAMVDYLDNETINRIVPVNAQTWADITGMVNGTTPYQPLANYQQINSSSAITNLIGRGTQMGANDNFGAITNDTSGAFSTAVRSSLGGTQGNTVNPGGTTNRYRRRLQEKQAALAGSMQTAMVAAADGLASGNAPAPWQRAATRGLTSRGMGNAAPAQQAQSSQAVEEAVQAATINPQPEVKQPVKQQVLFNYPGDDGKSYPVISETFNVDENSWKSNPAQRFHPAWCRRTHHIRYFQLENNWIVAVPTKYSEEELAIAMNYDAHEIDPRLGKPQAHVTPKPPKEEAKVLYASKEEIRFVVKRMENWSMQASVDTAIQSAVLDAESVGGNSDAVIRNTAVNIPVVYESVIGAMKDLEIVEKISGCATFVEAAKLIPQLENQQIRETINKWMTLRVNRLVACDLGLKVSFTDFASDAGEILKEVERDLGDNVQVVAARQNHIISGVVSGILAANDEMTGYVDTEFVGSDEERKALAERTIFLVRDISVTWMKFNSSELAIGVPAFGAAVVAESLYPALHGILTESMKESLTNPYFDNILITRDGVKFRAHSSVLNKSVVMISKYH